jgi:hypothetical protein
VYEKVALQRPHLASRGQSNFVKRSVCGNKEELFISCAQKQNDLNKRKFAIDVPNKARGMFAAITKKVFGKDFT